MTNVWTHVDDHIHLIFGDTTVLVAFSSLTKSVFINEDVDPTDNITLTFPDMTPRVFCLFPGGVHHGSMYRQLLQSETSSRKTTAATTGKIGGIE